MLRASGWKREGQTTRSAGRWIISSPRRDRLARKVRSLEYKQTVLILLVNWNICEELKDASLCAFCSILFVKMDVWIFKWVCGIFQNNLKHYLENALISRNSWSLHITYYVVFKISFNLFCISSVVNKQFICSSRNRYTIQIWNVNKEVDEWGRRPRVFAVFGIGG